MWCEHISGVLLTGCCGLLAAFKTLLTRLKTSHVSELFILIKKQGHKLKKNTTNIYEYCDIFLSLEVIFEMGCF